MKQFKINIQLANKLDVLLNSMLAASTITFLDDEKPDNEAMNEVITNLIEVKCRIGVYLILKHCYGEQEDIDKLNEEIHKSMQKHLHLI